DVDEVARPVLDRLRQPGPILVTHAALEDVEHHLEADVDMRMGHAARRDRCHVHGKLLSADVPGAHPGPVPDVIPAAAVAPTPNDRTAFPALDAAPQLFVRDWHLIGGGHRGLPPRAVTRCSTGPPFIGSRARTSASSGLRGL